MDLKNNQYTSDSPLDKIRILQLGSPSGLYGAEQWILALVNHLDPTSIESWIGSVKDDPNLDVPLCKKADLLGFKTFIFEGNGKINFSVLKQIKRFIEDRDISIIHSHGYKTDLVSLLSAKGTKCKVITTPHGWTKNPDLKLWLYELLDRCSFPFFDAVVPLSKSLFKEIKIIPGIKKRLYHINNGVDIDEIESEANISAELKSLKNKGFFIIGYIGRLIRGKGLQILMDAMAQYSAPNWKVVLVGDGEFSTELKVMAQEKGISDKILFSGFKSNRISYLKGFDIYILPSRSEGIPRCLMEAMAAGIPVIASDIPGCRYLIDGKTTGLLVKPGKVKELADAIKKLELDTNLGYRLSINAKEFIYSNFSAKKMAKKYEELYFNLINKN